MDKVRRKVNQLLKVQSETCEHVKVPRQQVHHAAIGGNRRRRKSRARRSDG